MDLSRLGPALGYSSKQSKPGVSHCCVVQPRELSVPFLGGLLTSLLTLQRVISFQELDFETVGLFVLHFQGVRLFPFRKFDFRLFVGEVLGVFYLALGASVMQLDQIAAQNAPSLVALSDADLCGA